MEKLPPLLERVKRERDNWIETCNQESRNRDYYRGLVVQIGEMFGDEAKTANDGGLHTDVLCAKVPELVIALIKYSGYRKGIKLL